MLYVSVGKVGIAEEGVVFELLVVDGDGSGKIGNSIVHAVELKVDFGSVVIEVVIFGMLVDFDVEHVENVLIGHVFCGGAVVATSKCRKERQEKDEYKGLMFHEMCNADKCFLLYFRNNFSCREVWGVSLCYMESRMA